MLKRWVLFCCVFFTAACNLAYAQDASTDLFRAAFKFYQADDFKSAADLFSKGLKISHDKEASGKASWYYGNCLVKLNEPRQALAAYERAVELSPNSDQGRQARVDADRVRQSVNTTASRGPAGAVKAFSWMYNFQPSPGLRTWTLDAQGKWREQYPDGHVAKVFDVVRRGTAKQCEGALVSSSSEPEFEVFIPDTGCGRMVAMFRRENGAWSNLGEMENVR